jgi:hypothetical protein
VYVCEAGESVVLIGQLGKLFPDTILPIAIMCKIPKHIRQRDCDRSLSRADVVEGFGIDPGCANRLAHLSPGEAQSLYKMIFTFRLVGSRVTHCRRNSSRAPFSQVLLRGKEVSVSTEAGQDSSGKAVRPWNVEKQRVPHLAVFEPF